MRDKIEKMAIQSVAELCERTIVGCQSEFVAQHCIMEAVLQQLPDARLEVGATNGSGLTRKQIKIVRKMLDCVPVRRTLDKGSSLDLMIVSPIEYKMEIKARSMFSSSDNVATQSIARDIERVMTNRVDGFLLVSDSKIYNQLASSAIGGRGRPRAENVDLYYPLIAGAGSGVYKQDGLTNTWVAVNTPILNIFRVVSLLTGGTHG
jgi:hypothetical protein